MDYQPHTYDFLASQPKWPKVVDVICFMIIGVGIGMCATSWYINRGDTSGQVTNAEVRLVPQQLNAKPLNNTKTTLSEQQI
jgi:hypothetical protein